MPRSAPPPVIPAKVFRQFAIITAVITLGIAALTDGGDAQAIEGLGKRVNKAPAAASVKPAGPERLGVMNVAPDFAPADDSGPDLSDQSGVGEFTAETLMGGQGDYEGADLPVPQRCRRGSIGGIDHLTGMGCQGTGAASASEQALSAQDRRALFEASRQRSGEAEGAE